MPGEPAWYGPNGEPEDRNADPKLQSYLKKPDEFHHQAFYTTAPKDLNSSHNDPPESADGFPDYQKQTQNPAIDFDGYNDYGVANYSRTEKKLTKGSVKKNSNNGSKTTGNRPEVHRHKNQ